MYDNILGQYYDCVSLLPAAQPRPSLSSVTSVRPAGPHPPNPHVSLRQIQLSYPASPPPPSQPRRSVRLRGLQEDDDDEEDVNHGPTTPVNNGISLTEEMATEAARLIRARSSSGDGSGNGKDQENDAREMPIEMASEMQGSDVIEAPRPAQKVAEEEKEEEEQGNRNHNGEDPSHSPSIIEEEVINEYSQLERLLTTFIYEVPRRRSAARL